MYEQNLTGLNASRKADRKRIASALECAALVVARCLLGLIDVTDEEDA